MTAAFRRGEVLYGRVPHPDGGSVIRRLSRDKATAKAMERMLATLRDQEEWEILRAVIDKRLTVSAVYAAWPHGLQGLRTALRDVDVEPYVAQWVQTLSARFGATGDTTKQYTRQVRTLIPKGKPFARSELTVSRLESWVVSLPATSPTKLRYHAAMSSFCEYLTRAKVLDRNPMRDVPSPKASAPRVRYISVEQAIELAETQAEPFRTLCILSHCGIEQGAGRKVRKRDVNVQRHTIHVRGTKRETRDRVCYIPDWAWPFVVDALTGLHPDALIAPGCLPSAIGKSHRAACERLGIADYRFHDGRHSYAVRLASAGAPLEIIARQLGHANIKQAAICYARFRPSEDDMARWERVAAAKDAEEKQA